MKLRHARPQLVIRVYSCLIGMILKLFLTDLGINLNREENVTMYAISYLPYNKEDNKYILNT